ncbi:MAG: TlpA disulfide reductase family protein [Acidobacteriota bacterium]
MRLVAHSSKSNIRLLIRAFVMTSCLALMVFAGPKLGIEDTPELPAPDGSNDTPEMIISMINNGPAAASQPSKIKLSSMRGRVVLLDMFYSQCPHCRDHAPHMVEFYNEFKPRGFSVLGLATDRPEKVADVRSFMRDLKVNYPVGFVTTDVIAYFVDSHNHGVPQMILFGADGKMLKRWIGWSDVIAKELRTLVQDNLGKAPAVKPGSKATTRNNEGRVKRA